MSKKNNKLKISWIGLDGFLVALFFVIVAILFFAITTHNDLIIGTIVPYGFMLVVTIIFINYLYMIFKFKKPIPTNEKPEKEEK